MILRPIGLRASDAPFEIDREASIKREYESTTAAHPGAMASYHPKFAQRLACASVLSWAELKRGSSVAHLGARSQTRSQARR
jgi:hypothetical protein